MPHCPTWTGTPVRGTSSPQPPTPGGPRLGLGVRGAAARAGGTRPPPSPNSHFYPRPKVRQRRGAGSGRRPHGSPATPGGFDGVTPGMWEPG